MREACHWSRAYSAVLAGGGVARGRVVGKTDKIAGDVADRPVSPKDLRKGDRKAIRTAFDKLYEHRYAHSSPDDPVEMVNMRLSVIGKRPTLKFPRLGKGRGSAITHRRDVYFSDTKKAVR